MGSERKQGLEDRYFFLFISIIYQAITQYCNSQMLVPFLFYTLAKIDKCFASSETVALESNFGHLSLNCQEKGLMDC